MISEKITNEELEMMAAKPVNNLAFVPNHALAVNMAKELLALRKAQEGWKLVPVEPTWEMLRAWRGDMHKSYAKNHIEHIGDDEIVFAWTAMLTAAPEPE